MPEEVGEGETMLEEVVRESQRNRVSIITWLSFRLIIRHSRLEPTTAIHEYSNLINLNYKGIKEGLRLSVDVG